MIASFLGYGCFLAKCLKIKVSPLPLDNVLLNSGWGACFVCTLGGWLMLFNLATAPILVAIVVTGIVYFIIHSLTHAGFSSKKSPTLSILVVVFCIIYGIDKSLDFCYDTCDDCLAYLYMPEKILHTGSLIEPFSIRRMTSYGGGSFLQALCLSVVPLIYQHVFERAICTSLTILGFLEIRQTLGVKSPWATLLLLLPALATLPFDNGSAVRSIGFLSLLMMLTDMSLFGNSIGVAVLRGMICASLLSLKGTMAIFLPIYWFFIYFDKRSLRREAWIEAGVFFLSLVLSILPWALQLYQSNGTIYYPAFKGYESSNYNLLTLVKAPSVLVRLATMFTYFQSTPSIVCCFIAWMVGSHLLQNRFIIAFHRSVILFILLLGWTLSPFPELPAISGIERYTIGLILTSVVLSLLTYFSTLESHPETLTFPLLRYTSVICCICAILLIRLPGEVFYLFNVEPPDVYFSPEIFYRDKDSFRRAQQLVPTGERVIVYVDRPFMMDLGRNNVFLGDMPGGSSLPPGLPFGRGIEPLRRYFLQEDIHYIIHIDFDIHDFPASAPTTFSLLRPGRPVNIFSRRLWTDEYPKTGPTTAAMSVFFLDLINNLEGLDHQLPTKSVRRVGDLIVVRLDGDLADTPQE